MEKKNSCAQTFGDSDFWNLSCPGRERPESEESCGGIESVPVVLAVVFFSSPGYKPVEVSVVSAASPESPPPVRGGPHDAVSASVSARRGRRLGRGGQVLEHLARLQLLRQTWVVLGRKADAFTTSTSSTPHFPIEKGEREDYAISKLAVAKRSNLQC